MVVPSSFNDINDIHYYQGVIIAEVAVTLCLYIVLKIIHYVKWGYLQEVDAKGSHPNAGNDEEATTKKWDQKVWDVYFPIVYTNHMAALSLSLLYIPYIFETIMAYVHLAGFLGLVIVNIFIKDAESGNGNRTITTRVIWLIMCASNIAQLIAGLTGVAKVL